MRRAEGKRFGYIIVPVVVEPGSDVASALMRGTEGYQTVGRVLRALQAHDGRLAESPATFVKVYEQEKGKAPADRRDGERIREETASYQVQLDLKEAEQGIYAHVAAASGLGKPGQIVADEIADAVTQASAVLQEEELEVRSPLLGSFNLSNLLAAAAAASSLGADRDALRDGIAACPPIPGRFEQIDCGQSFHVIVDYAHTPDALRNVLATARQLGPKRVLVLFGCGGERDRSKRPAMGAIAEQHSDWVMLTSDNARGEDPLAILGEIQAGFRSDRHETEPDRREAIRRLFSRAESGDVVILAGKGHEVGQQEAGRIRPFDDRQVARAVLREMDYGDAAFGR